MKRAQNGMVICCRVGGLLVGIDLAATQEINRQVEPTFVPLLQPHVRGLINLRGNLVTVLDLGQIVRGSTTAGGAQTRCVVVELGEEVVGLLVDAVGDVVDTAGRRREALPTHLPQDQQQWFSGMVQLERELLLLLDVAAVGRFGTAAAAGNAR